MKGWHDKSTRDREAAKKAHAEKRAELQKAHLEALAEELAPLVAELLKKGGRE